MSIQTTERSRGTEQTLAYAVNDRIGLDLIRSVCPMNNKVVVRHKPTSPARQLGNQRRICEKLITRTGIIDQILRSAGMKTLMEVPDRTPCVLRHQIIPPLFSTRLFVTQSPMPPPHSPLVVKNAERRNLMRAQHDRRRRLRGTGETAGGRLRRALRSDYLWCSWRPSFIRMLKDISMRAW